MPADSPKHISQAGKLFDNRFYDSPMQSQLGIALDPFSLLG